MRIHRGALERPGMKARAAQRAAAHGVPDPRDAIAARRKQPATVVLESEPLDPTPLRMKEGRRPPIQDSRIPDADRPVAAPGGERPAVGAEGGGHDRVQVTEGPDLPGAGRHVPEPGPAVVAGGQQPLPFAIEVHGPDEDRVVLHLRTDRRARRDSPELGGGRLPMTPIGTRRDQPRPTGSEADGPSNGLSGGLGRVGAACQRDRMAVGEVPEPGASVETARREKPPIRREVHALDRSAVVEHRPRLLSGVRFPEPRPGIGGGGDGQGPIGAEGDGQHRSAVPQRRCDRAAGRQLPELRRAVLAAGEGPGPVGADGHGGHAPGECPRIARTAEPSGSSDRCSGGSPVAGPAGPPGRIPGPGPARAGHARPRSARTGSHPP